MSYLIGVLLALGNIWGARAIGLDRDRGVYAVLLAVVASTYILFASMVGSTALVVSELLIALPFLVVMRWGFQMNLWWIVAGLAAHGFVDAIHGQIITNDGVPEWWPAFCASYDITAALVLGVMLSTAQGRRVAIPTEGSVRRPFGSAAAFQSARMLSIALTLMLLTGCMSMMQPPTTLDYGRVRNSAGGLYRATIIPDGDSIPTGKLQQWKLRLETMNGSPVDSASVGVDGGMPQHGHGLPTKPLVTRSLGHGEHLVEGMKFNMGGWWVVKFRIRAAAGADSVVFNLKL